MLCADRPRGSPHTLTSKEAGRAPARARVLSGPPRGLCALAPHLLGGLGRRAVCTKESLPEKPRAESLPGKHR